MTSSSSPYRVFARKYRPRTFEEVIGQDHIVHALSRAIERGRLGQAYMLIGPRGVGKTTTARIIAKSINCENGPTIKPCLQCSQCAEIERGSDMDVIEIDGASHNGVDDVRSIREAVQTSPIRDSRKVYIIDEVQRLSGQAFDALLKTLEEPPSHAVFLFATTDPHKIPDTIVSRCQVFEFRRLRETDIYLKLKNVCEQEKVHVSDEVLETIARGCKGGMRDAESMLDQLIATSGEDITSSDLESIAGLARPERWLRLYRAIARDEPELILKEISEYLSVGGTERDFVEQSAEALRDLLHIALLGEDSLGIIPEEKRKAEMFDLARELGRDRIEGIMGMIFSLESRMQKSPLGARALLEWTFLRASRLNQFFELGQLLEQQVNQSVIAKPKASSGSDVVKKPQKKTNNVANFNFEESLSRLAVERPTLGKYIKEYLIAYSVEDEQVILDLRKPQGEAYALLSDPVEHKILAQLSWSPYPWHLRFQETKEVVKNPTVELLLNEFDGQQHRD